MAISFSGVQGLVDKANKAVSNVTTSKTFQQMTGVTSQIAKRIATPQDLANLPDALQTHQWEAIFPGIDLSTGVGDINAFTNLGNYVPICESISFEWPDIKTQNLKLGPAEVNVPVKKTTGCTFAADFYCDMNASILQYFESWRKLVVHDDQIVGVAEEYKKRMYFYIMGLRSTIPVYLIKFKGIYPIKISGFKFNSNSERQKVAIQFSCDVMTGEPLATGQAMTSLANNLAGNALTKFGSISALAGQYMGDNKGIFGSVSNMFK